MSEYFTFERPDGSTYEMNEDQIKEFEQFCINKKIRQTFHIMKMLRRKEIPSYNDPDTFPQPRINTYDFINSYKCDFMFTFGVEASNTQTKRSTINGNPERQFVQTCRISVNTGSTKKLS